MQEKVRRLVEIKACIVPAAGNTASKFGYCGHGGHDAFVVQASDSRHGHVAVSEPEGAPSNSESGRQLRQANLKAECRLSEESKANLGVGVQRSVAMDH